MDKAFTQYLNSSGNRSRLTGDIKSDNSGDDERYAIIGAVTATFKVVQTLSNVFSKLSAKIAKSIVIANKALTKATAEHDKAKADKEAAAKAEAEQKRKDDQWKAIREDNARKDEEEQRKKNLQRLEDATKMQQALDADAKAKADKEAADKRAAAKAKREANSKAKMEKKLASKPELEAKKRYYGSSSENWDTFLDF